MTRSWIAPEDIVKRVFLFTGLVSFFLFGAFLSTVQAQVDESYMVCLPSFAARGLHPKQVEILESVFFYELVKGRRYWLVPRREVIAAEKVMREPDPEVRKSNEYYFFLADQVNADLVVGVSIQPSSRNHYTIMAQVLDAFERKSMEVFIQESDNTKEGLKAAMSALAQKVSGLGEEEIVVSFLAQLEADIAFCSNRDGDWDIYLLEADERYPLMLTKNFTTDYSPSWSADGKRLAYSSRRNRNYEIVVLETVTGEVMDLTNNRTADVTPNWGRSGGFLAYCSLRGKHYQIILRNLESGKESLLTKDPLNKFFPHISPDGKHLIYSAGDPSALYLLTIEDGSVAKLLADGKANYSAVFSPDGKQVAFETTRDGNYEIYLMNVDDKELVNLTRHPASDISPTFSPDGRWLAFCSDRVGNNEIFVMSIQGGYVTNITLNPKDDRLPAWSPVHLKRKTQ